MTKYCIVGFKVEKSRSLCYFKGEGEDFLMTKTVEAFRRGADFVSIRRIKEVIT